jgi:acyl carrier protein
LNRNAVAPEQLAVKDEEVLTRLSSLVGDLLELDELTLSMTTTAQHVAGWDSLAHVRIVLAAEQAFGVRFTTGEIASLKTVGDLVNLIKDHSRG